MEFENDVGIGHGGTTCWFELADGARISIPPASTGKNGSPVARELGCVISVSDSAAEVYRLTSDSRPIATRVLRFDGHTFTDVTTRWKRWLSPLIHTWGHIWHYLIPLAFLFIALTQLHRLGGHISKTSPRRGMRLALQIVWVPFYVLAILICIFVILFYVTGFWSPTSPLVFLVFFVVGFMLYRWLRARHEPKMQGKGAL
jgi:hypothetical protein